MTNMNKYKTADERRDAFYAWCNTQVCSKASLDECIHCAYKWLELDPDENGKEVA